MLLLLNIDTSMDSRTAADQTNKHVYLQHFFSSCHSDDYSGLAVSSGLRDVRTSFVSLRTV